MIDDSVLIQVDATIIAGILILLTMAKFPNDYSDVLSKYVNSNKKIIRYFANVVNDSWIRLTPRQAVGIVIIPFSISAVFLLSAINPLALVRNPLAFDIASWLSGAGFLYLILVIVTLKTSLDVDGKPSSSEDTHSKSPKR